MRLSLLIFVLLVLVWEAFGQIIPSNRLITWQGNIGIPGGVPTTRTVFTNIAAGASTAVIQSALDTCPSNQVVLLAAGTYNLSTFLQMRSGVTLRGAGPQQTVLSRVNSWPGFLYFGDDSDPFNPGSTITAGATMGSSNITVSSLSGVNIGGYLAITEDNTSSPLFISSQGGNGGGLCTQCYAPYPSTGNVIGQIGEVTAINGSVVTIWPPLFIDYPNNPHITGAFNASLKNAGAENLTLSAQSGSQSQNITFGKAAYCWCKNIESDFTGGEHVEHYWCYRCEFRDSYVHDGYNHSPGVDNSFYVSKRSTGLLIENNIFWRLHPSVTFRSGAAGNVLAYNFSTNAYHTPDPANVYGFLNYHGAHPNMNLVEGNIVGGWIWPDAIWGTSSYTTFLRNSIAAIDFTTYPLDSRGAINSATVQTYQAFAFDISWGSQFNNMVGNVMGCGLWAARGLPFEYDWPAIRNTAGAASSWGYDSSSDTGGWSQDSTRSRTTALVEGNYDYSTHSQHWSAGVQVISNSYYLSAKPTWFGPLAWPPVDPANPGLVTIQSIPAGYRFLFGTNPPSSGTISNLTLAYSNSDFGLIFTNQFVTNNYVVTYQGPGTVQGTCTVAAPFFVTGSNTWALTSNQSQIVSIYFGPVTGAFSTNTATFSGANGAAVNLVGSSVIVQPALTFNADAGTISFPYIVDSAHRVLQTNATGANIVNGGRDYFGFQITNTGAYTFSNTCSPTNISWSSLWWNVDGPPTNGLTYGYQLWDLPPDGTNTFGMGWRGTGTFQSNSFPLVVWNLTNGPHMLCVVGQLPTNFCIGPFTVSAQQTNQPAVTANFSAGPTNGAVPLTVTFTNLSANANAFSWNFGDAQFSQLSNNFTHTYTVARTYDVVLTAFGPAGTNSVTNAGYITATNIPVPPPVANFTAAPTNGAAPLTVYFTNLSSNALSYFWSLGPTNLCIACTSFATNPVYTYQASTNTVTLTANGLTTNNILSLTNYIVVTNLPAPVASFFGVPTNGASPLQVIFANNSTGETNTVWNFGDGTPLVSVAYPFGPSHVYASGTYTVSMTAQGAGGTNQLSFTNYIVVTNGTQPSVVLLVPWFFRAFTQ